MFSAHMFELELSIRATIETELKGKYRKLILTCCMIWLGKFFSPESENDLTHYDILKTFLDLLIISTQ